MSFLATAEGLHLVCLLRHRPTVARKQQVNRLVKRWMVGFDHDQIMAALRKDLLAQGALAEQCVHRRDRPRQVAACQQCRHGADLIALVAHRHLAQHHRRRVRHQADQMQFLPITPHAPHAFAINRLSTPAYRLGRWDRTLLHRSDFGFQRGHLHLLQRPSHGRFAGQPVFRRQSLRQLALVAADPASDPLHTGHTITDCGRNQHQNHSPFVSLPARMAWVGHCRQRLNQCGILDLVHRLLLSVFAPESVTDGFSFLSHDFDTALTTYSRCI